MFLQNGSQEFFSVVITVLNTVKHLANMPRRYAESLFQFTCVKILEIGKSNHFAMMMLDPFSQRKTDKCGGVVEEKKDSILLLLTFKALK